MCELHDVRVLVSVAGAPTPRFDPWRMKNLCARRDRALMCTVEVIDTEAHLRSRGPLALALVESEVEKPLVGPCDRSVTAADPAIRCAVVASLVVGDVEVKPEAVAVERHCTIEVRNLKHDRHQPTRLRHVHIMSEASVGCPRCRPGTRRTRAR